MIMCIYHQGFDETVYTFGFGSDHDASMMEAISTQGGGVYYYIDTNEKVCSFLRIASLYVQHMYTPTIGL